MSEDEQLKNEMAIIIASETPKNSSPKEKKPPRKESHPAVSQTATGNNIIQVGGDLISPQKRRHPLSLFSGGCFLTIMIAFSIFCLLLAFIDLTTDYFSKKVAYQMHLQQPQSFHNSILPRKY